MHSFHNFDRLNARGGNWWWFALALAATLLLFLLFHKCQPDNEIYHNSPPDYSYQTPDFPEQPGRSRPIDTTKIIIPNDPLKRPILSNILNVYLQDTVSIKPFATHLIRQYSSDSLKVTYYAEAYKRVQFQVPENKLNLLKVEIKRDFQAVKFVCFESIISNTSQASDPGYGDIDNYWFYEQVGVGEAWNTTTGDQNITVAIIDDSFDVKHPEFAGKIQSPWNVVAYNENLDTYNGTRIHGTHVAGTAVGNKDNGYGISGVAPKCSLMPIQIGDAQGRMTTSSILDGIFYALKNKAEVINLSLGMGPNSSNLSQSQQKYYANNTYLEEAAMWDEVYEIAAKEGAVIVQAAGNSNVLAQLDPMKRSGNLIVVGAVDRDRNPTAFTNYGEAVTLYAPGSGIYSSVPNNSFEKLDGPSMASPIVAGAVALLKSIDPLLTAAQIKELLLRTSTPSASGHPILQIDRAIDQISAL